MVSPDPGVWIYEAILWIERGHTMGGNGEATPQAVDVFVGARIAERRRQLGLSQSDLARALSITFQQVQKYERGVNRVSASKLWETAGFLGLAVSAFFPVAPDEPQTIEPCVPVSDTARAIGLEALALSARDQTLVSEVMHRFLSQERIRRSRRTL